MHAATPPGIFVIIVCAITIAATSDIHGDLGIDAKQLISVDEFKCLKNEGYTFFTVHLLHSRSGRYDKNGMQTLKNALAAGFGDIHGYLYPCPDKTCPSASQQVDTVADALAVYSVFPLTLWVDVESDKYWPRNKTFNRIFIAEMVKRIRENGFNAGIYASRDAWVSLVNASWMDITWPPFVYLPLWWVETNNQKNLKNYRHFGNWGLPSVHQYHDPKNKDPHDVDPKCKVKVDYTWKPSDFYMTNSTCRGSRCYQIFTNIGPDSASGIAKFADQWCQRVFGGRLLSVHSKEESRFLHDFTYSYMDSSLFGLICPTFAYDDGYGAPVCEKHQWLDGTAYDYSPFTHYNGSFHYPFNTDTSYCTFSNATSWDCSDGTDKTFPWGFNNMLTYTVH